MLQLKYYFFKNATMLIWPYSYGKEHQEGLEIRYAKSEHCELIPFSLSS